MCALPCQTFIMHLAKDLWQLISKLIWTLSFSGHRFDQSHLSALACPAPACKRPGYRVPFFSYAMDEDPLSWLTISPNFQTKKIEIAWPWFTMQCAAVWKRTWKNEPKHRKTWKENMELTSSKVWFVLSRSPYHLPLPADKSKRPFCFVFSWCSHEVTARHQSRACRLVSSQEALGKRALVNPEVDLAQPLQKRPGHPRFPLRQQLSHAEAVSRLPWAAVAPRWMSSLMPHVLELLECHVPRVWKRWIHVLGKWKQWIHVFW